MQDSGDIRHEPFMTTTLPVDEQAQAEQEECSKTLGRPAMYRRNTLRRFKIINYTRLAIFMFIAAAIVTSDRERHMKTLYCHHPNSKVCTECEYRLPIIAQKKDLAADHKATLSTQKQTLDTPENETLYAHGHRTTFAGASFLDETPSNERRMLIYDFLAGMLLCEVSGAKERRSCA